MKKQYGRPPLGTVWYRDIWEVRVWQEKIR